jgi:putative NADH-flavin reductase
MKIALIGASGNVGSRIAAELSSRGHEITAIARKAAKISALPGVKPTAVDIANTEALVPILKGHAAVISSVHFVDSDPDQLIRAVNAAGVPRYLVVGALGAFKSRPANFSSTRQTSRRSTRRKLEPAVSSSIDCARRKILTGRSCRHPPSSLRASALESFVLARTPF